MNNQSDYESKHQELNCSINVIPILRYLEDLYGYKKMSEFIEPLGLSISFLLNKRNWVSYKYYIKLLEKLVEVTGDVEAPFKAPFSTKPQTVWEDLIYATYSSLFSNPKQMYRMTFNKNIYKRFTKIGDFNIISSSHNSIVIQVKLHPGYKQHPYNCEVIKGYLSSASIYSGLIPAKVEHEICAAKNSDKCIYKISWEKPKRLKKVYWNILLPIIFIGFEFLLFIKKIDIKIITITILFSLLLFLLNRIYKFIKRIQENEIFSYKRNKTLIEAMEKIEHDYNELMDTKQKVDERNIYLAIIGDINKSITVAMDYDELFASAADIISKNLNFDKAIYFHLDKKDNLFYSMFELKNRRVILHKDDDKKLVILNNDFIELEKLGFTLSLSYMQDLVKKNAKRAKSLADFKKYNQIYLLPIDISRTYTGFYLFFTNEDLAISKELLNSLFKNTSSQLIIGYQKISSRYVIESILSSIPAYVLIINVENYEINYANNMFLKAFPKTIKKFTKSNIFGKNIFSILPLDRSFEENIKSNIELIALGKDAESYEVTVGSIVLEYNMFRIPQYKEGEKLAGIIMTDITEAKSFQQKLLINEKLLGLGRVASGIAHEINNPLYAVLACAEEISENENVSEEVKKEAGEIVGHIVNVSNIIKDLSIYSKTLRKEDIDEVDINDVIEESIKLVRYGSNFLEVDVVKDLSSLPIIKAAKGQLQQIFINLFNNAIQAMNGKGRLEVVTKCNKGEIFISVTDNGPGIPEDVLPFIFDLFFTTKKPGEGTGQGLHIVKKILDIYNGKIEVKSKVGKGTTFFITFII